MGEGGQDFGHQWPGIGEAVAGSFQADDGNAEFCEILLFGQAGVHRDQYVELFVGAGEKHSVLQSSPADERHRGDGMTGEVALQPPVEVLSSSTFTSSRL